MDVCVRSTVTFSGICDRWRDLRHLAASQKYRATSSRYGTKIGTEARIEYLNVKFDRKYSAISPQ
jgi:hypothetical protein